jgi:hypothetical protein
MIMDILQIVILLAMSVALFRYLPSYLKKKAENLATKEDIGLVTREVEKVKNEFIKETEIVKAHLNLAFNAKQNLMDVEREIVIQFIESIHTWIQYHMNWLSCDPSNAKTITTYNAKIQTAYENLMLQEAKFDLFVTDKEIIDTKNKLKMAVLTQLVPISVKLFMELMNLSAKGAVDANYLKSFTQHCAEYATASLGKYADINPLFQQLRMQLRAYLYKLFDEYKQKTLMGDNETVPK